MHVAADIRREIFSVGVAQSVNARIAVLAARAAVIIAGPSVETMLLGYV